MTTRFANLPFRGVSPLPHLGVIRASGEDAADFLHNQLTQDVLLLKPDQARLAAFCNAKGRMQASFVLFKRADDEVLLVCRRDLLAQTLKRLSMFVLRAKVRLHDASEELHVIGLAADAVTQAMARAGGSGNTLLPWQRVSAPDADVITLYPAMGQPRALWLASQSVPLPTDLGPAMPLEMWQLGEVMSGIAWVEHATYEAFVPQMLNYESVDGVNFKKGCYPGQEVVARSQFRGTLKRRAFIASSPSPLAAGQEVFASDDVTQPCGVVAQAACAHDVHVAVVVLQLNAIEASLLHVGQPDGPLLTLLPLPYALRDDI